MHMSYIRKLTLAIAGCAALSSLSAFGQETQPREAAGAPSAELDLKLNRLLLEMEKVNFKVDKLSGAPVETAPPAAPEDLARLKEELGTLQQTVSQLSATSPAGAPMNADEGTLAALEEKLQRNINTVWIIAAAALVFFMQAGFCMLETGMARAKNSINVTMKNFMDFGFATLAYLFIGFAVMFGNSHNGWFGTGPFWLSQYDSSSPVWAFWIFQAVFAGTATTIVSGAMAERTKFMGYVVFSIFFSALIYPLVGHWGWGGAAEGMAEGFGAGKGWLAAMGFSDFAGSTIVHAAGGASALAGIIVLGPRIGRFAADGSPRLIPPHNIPLAAVGAFTLWFGWFGFNAGSTLVGDVSIGRIAANTTIAGAAGSIFAMFSSWKVEGRPDAMVAMNGALAGLVSITACCFCVTPASAAALGAIAGLITTYGGILLEKLKLDDVVGAVPVHLFAGIWGTLCVAIFNENGFDAKALATQAIGTFSVVGACFVATFTLFKICAAMGILRATEREEEDGLDFAEHASNAYADFEIASR
jgi:Amt family ammonium transporter